MKFIVASSLVALVILLLITFYPVKKQEIPDYGFDPNQTEASSPAADGIKLVELDRDNSLNTVETTYSDADLMCSLHNICDHITPKNDIIVEALPEQNNQKAKPDSTVAASDVVDEEESTENKDEIDRLLNELNQATKTLTNADIAN